MLREELSFLSPRFHANINSHYDAFTRKGHHSPSIACLYHVPQAGVSPPQVCIMYSCSPHRQAPFHPLGVHHVTPTPRHATCAPPPQVCSILVWPILLMLLNDRDVVASSKQNLIIRGKSLTIQEGSMFAHCPSLFSFSFSNKNNIYIFFLISILVTLSIFFCLSASLGHTSAWQR